MKRLPLILAVIFLSGCFTHLPFKRDTAVPLPEFSGNVVDAAKLKTAAKLGFSSFRAGPQAAADDQLDRLSLMLIKGIKDSLEAKKVSLATTDQEEGADVVMDGYIEEFSRKRFSVSGELWDKETGAKVLVFGASRVLRPKKDNPMDTAYEVGTVIGDYIAAQRSGT